jgi:hypothetical protein
MEASMDQALAFGLLRHVLQLAAGALVARGYLETSMVESTVGGLMAVGAAGWYAAGKIRR